MDDDDEPMLPVEGQGGLLDYGDGAGGGDAAPAPPDAAYCPGCQGMVDEVEEIGGSLICLTCGTALEDASLVNQHTRGAGGGRDEEPTGVIVAQHDTGAVAGAVLRSQQAGLVGCSGRNAGDTRAHHAALSAGATAAHLTPAAARDASELLPLVVRAYASAGRNVMPATLAATAYLAARNLMHGTSLSDVAQGFGVRPIDVGHHYLAILKLMGMPAPAPRLEALIVRHASVLLPRTFPEYTGALRAHPTVRMARQLGELLTALEALSGRSTAVAAAAVLALAFAAHGGAKSSTAAADVAALLGFDRKAVQSNMRDFEAELERLKPLLPFAAAAAPAQMMPHVPLLLRLNAVVARAQAYGGGTGMPQGSGSAVVGVQQQQASTEEL